MKFDVKKIVPVRFLTLLLALLIAGCSDDSLTAAPFGDYSALEKLGKSYEKMSDQFAVNPQKLNLDDRKRFVERVFSGAGYSYDETLLSAAKQKMKDKNHRDLAELLLLPAKGVGEADLSGLYDAGELLAIATLKSNLK